MAARSPADGARDVGTRGNAAMLGLGTYGIAVNECRDTSTKHAFTAHSMVVAMRLDLC